MSFKNRLLLKLLRNTGTQTTRAIYNTNMHLNLLIPTTMPPQTRNTAKAGKRSSDMLVRLGTKIHKRKQTVEVDSLGSESDGEMSGPKPTTKQTRREQRLWSW